MDVAHRKAPEQPTGTLKSTFKALGKAIKRAVQGGTGRTATSVPSGCAAGEGVLTQQHEAEPWEATGPSQAKEELDLVKRVLSKRERNLKVSFSTSHQGPTASNLHKVSHSTHSMIPTTAVPTPKKPAIAQTSAWAAAAPVPVSDQPATSTHGPASATAAMPPPLLAAPAGSRPRDDPSPVEVLEHESGYSSGWVVDPLLDDSREVQALVARCTLRTSFADRGDVPTVTARSLHSSLAPLSAAVVVACLVSPCQEPADPEPPAPDMPGAVSGPVQTKSPAFSRSTSTLQQRALRRAQTTSFNGALANTEGNAMRLSIESVNAAATSASQIPDVNPDADGVTGALDKYPTSAAGPAPHSLTTRRSLDTKHTAKLFQLLAESTRHMRAAGKQSAEAQPRPSMKRSASSRNVPGEGNSQDNADEGNLAILLGFLTRQEHERSVFSDVSRSNWSLAPVPPNSAGQGHSHHSVMKRRSVAHGGEGQHSSMDARMAPQRADSNGTFQPHASQQAPTRLQSNSFDLQHTMVAPAGSRPTRTPVARAKSSPNLQEGWSMWVQASGNSGLTPAGSARPPSWSNAAGPTATSTSSLSSQRRSAGVVRQASSLRQAPSYGPAGRGSAMTTASSYSGLSGIEASDMLTLPLPTVRETGHHSAVAGGSGLGAAQLSWGAGDGLEPFDMARRAKSWSYLRPASRSMEGATPRVSIEAGDVHAGGQGLQGPSLQPVFFNSSASYLLRMRSLSVCLAFLNTNIAGNPSLMLVLEELVRGAQQGRTGTLSHYLPVIQRAALPPLAHRSSSILPSSGIMNTSDGVGPAMPGASVAASRPSLEQPATAPGLQWLQVQFAVVNLAMSDYDIQPALFIHFRQASLAVPPGVVPANRYSLEGVHKEGLRRELPRLEAVPERTDNLRGSLDRPSAQPKARPGSTQLSETGPGLGLSSQLSLLAAGMAHIPCIVTIMALDGRVLWQNGRSVEFCGLAYNRPKQLAYSSLEHPCHTLRRLFVLDTSSLEQLMAAVKQGQSWSGLARMPVAVDLTEDCLEPGATITTTTLKPRPSAKRRDLQKRMSCAPTSAAANGGLSPRTSSLLSHFDSGLSSPRSHVPQPGAVHSQRQAGAVSWASELLTSLMSGQGAPKPGGEPVSQLSASQSSMPRQVSSSDNSSRDSLMTPPLPGPSISPATSVGAASPITSAVSGMAGWLRSKASPKTAAARDKRVAFRSSDDIQAVPRAQPQGQQAAALSPQARSVTWGTSVDGIAVGQDTRRTSDAQPLGTQDRTLETERSLGHRSSAGDPDVVPELPIMPATRKSLGKRVADANVFSSLLYSSAAADHVVEAIDSSDEAADDPSRLSAASSEVPMMTFTRAPRRAPARLSCEVYSTSGLGAFPRLPTARTCSMDIGALLNTAPHGLRASSMSGTADAKLDSPLNPAEQPGAWQSSPKPLMRTTSMARRERVLQNTAARTTHLSSHIASMESGLQGTARAMKIAKAIQAPGGGDTDRPTGSMRRSMDVYGPRHHISMSGAGPASSAATANRRPGSDNTIVPSTYTIMCVTKDGDTAIGNSSAASSPARIKTSIVNGVSEDAEVCPPVNTALLETLEEGDLGLIDPALLSACNAHQFTRQQQSQAAPDHMPVAHTQPGAYRELESLPTGAFGTAVMDAMAPDLGLGEEDEQGDEFEEDMYQWHEIEVHCIPGPVDMLLLTHHDVTRYVNAELEVKKVLDVEHKLLEEIFPRHVLEAMANKQGAGPRRQTSDTSLSPSQALTEHFDLGLPPEDPSLLIQHPSSKSYKHMTSSRKSMDSRRKSVDVEDHMSALARHHECVSILFADIASFTSMSNEIAPSKVMTFLNDLFTQFDELVEEHGVYKVETIGDCYMAAAGLLHKDADGVNTISTVRDPDHANKMLAFAQDMLQVAAMTAMPTPDGRPVQLRVGIHSGPCMSGVVGRKMPRFCLFGDTINTSSRMESTGKPACIHVSAETWKRLGTEEKADPGWRPTGGVEAKGKGVLETYLWSPTHYSS